jgi:aspartokinase
METIAVYWEQPIKTYGFQKVTDLVLVEFSYPLKEITSLGRTLSQDTLQKVKAEFIIVQESADTISITLCLSEKEYKDFWVSVADAPGSTPCKYTYPVGIIYFHGPHFGDRYGIAEATFSTLSEADIEIFASGCSASSVFVVLAQDDIARAENVLNHTFEVAK